MRLRLSPAALRDLAEATEFIAADNPDAAQRVRDRLVAASATLLDLPLMGSEDALGRRVLTVPGTDFRLIYAVRRDIILVLRIHHGARRWPPASR